MTENAYCYGMNIPYVFRYPVHPATTVTPILPFYPPVRPPSLGFLATSVNYQSTRPKFCSTEIQIPAPSTARCSLTRQGEESNKTMQDLDIDADASIDIMRARTHRTPWDSAFYRCAC